MTVAEEFAKSIPENVSQKDLLTVRGKYAQITPAGPFPLRQGQKITYADVQEIIKILDRRIAGAK